MRATHRPCQDEGHGRHEAGKIQEGDAKLKEGIGFTGKTFTRWSPDWVAAALAFEAAVKAYRIAKHSEKLVEANKLLANALCESNSFYNAATRCRRPGTRRSTSTIWRAPPHSARRRASAIVRATRKMAALVLLKCGKALQKTDAAAAKSF